MWDIPSASRKTTLATRRHLENKPFTGDATQLAFSPDGRTLAVLTNETGWASLLELWDIATRSRRVVSTGQPPAGGGERTQTQTQTVGVRIVFSSDGRTVVSSSDQGVIDATTGSRLTAPNYAVGTPLAGNNGLVAANNSHHKVTLWNGRSLR